MRFNLLNSDTFIQIKVIGGYDLGGYDGVFFRTKKGTYNESGIKLSPGLLSEIEPNEIEIQITTCWYLQNLKFIWDFSKIIFSRIDGVIHVTVNQRDKFDFQAEPLGVNYVSFTSCYNERLDFYFDCR